MLNSLEVSALESHEYKLGRVKITRVTSQATRHTNRRGDLKSGAPEYDIIIPERATISFCQGDRSGDAGPGSYLLLKRDIFYELSSQLRLDHWLITIPGADMRSRLSSVDDHLGMRFTQNKRMAEMLYGLIYMISSTFRNESPPNAEAFATEIINFAALVLGSEERQEASVGRHTRYMLKQRIFDYVESQLGDASLSPQKIAKTNRISLSYLYKLFKDNNTTVGQFLQAKRLQRAFELLVADPKGAVTVSEIAYLVGFKNASHFSRAFSQHFNIAPRDARQCGLTRQEPAADTVRSVKLELAAQAA